MIVGTHIRDSITPDLQRRIRAHKDTASILEAIGGAIVAIAIDAFKQSSLRPSTWAPTKRNTQAPLYDTGALKHSIRILSSSSDSVTVGSDRPYAAVHQLGARPFVITPKSAKALFWPGAKHPVKRIDHPGIPARPFFPFDASGKITAEADRRIKSTVRDKLAAASR